MNILNLLHFFLFPKSFLSTKRGRALLSKWSKSVKKRDKKCLRCGARNNLHAHHIKQKHKHPRLAFNTNNGATLCDNCHRMFHINFGYWGGVKEFKEFISKRKKG